MIGSAALVAALLVLLAWPTASPAEIYRWTDERGVTHYSEGFESVPEQYRARAAPTGLHNAPLASPAPAAGGPVAPGRAVATGGTEIKFTPGREILVDVRLNGSTAVKLLLDTGAQRTVINPRALVAAGVALQTGRAVQMKGATGTASVNTVQVDSVEVGEARVATLVVISHDIDHDDVDGLLGRDFLDQFKVSIDNREGLVTLNPR
jgi:predicted aspartyl protease